MVDLVAGIKKGNEKYLEYLYNEYSGSLLCFVASYVGDGERAKDIVQESFISFWNSRERLWDNANLKSILYTIAKNKSLNFIRDEKLFSRHVKLSECNEASILAIDTTTLEATEMESQIQTLFDELPEIYKDVFLRNREKGQTYSQIAKELSISQKSVEKRMSKVLSLFRKNLHLFFIIIGRVLS